MGGFTFRLEHEDGTPAEPRTFDAAVPNWRPGDTIHLGPGKVLRVVAIVTRRGSAAETGR